jgi:hypothetical protein
MAGLLGKLWPFAKSNNATAGVAARNERLPPPATGPTFSAKMPTNTNAARMNAIQEELISRNGVSEEDMDWFNATQKKYNIQPLDKKQWIHKHITLLNSEIDTLSKDGPSLRLLDAWEIRNILRGRIGLAAVPIPEEVEATRAQLSIPRAGAGSPMLGNAAGFAANLEGAPAPPTPMVGPVELPASHSPPATPFTVTTQGGRRLRKGRKGRRTIKKTKRIGRSKSRRSRN